MKELKFIHICKNAGTSIENIGKVNNINWGRYDLFYKNCSIDKQTWWHKVIKKNNNYDWFMVVRNPYDRIISEFYCPYDKIDKINFTKDEFNKYIQMKIRKRETQQGHYMPQYLHLDSNITLHILKFENLDEEFNNLMKLYNLDIKLNRHDNKSIKHKYTVEDLDMRSILFINGTYNKDFEYFSYEKIDHLNRV